MAILNGTKKLKIMLSRQGNFASKHHVGNVMESKNSQIVKAAFFTVKSELRIINLFHTDRGGEFKNTAVEGVQQRLSVNALPAPNAVAENMYCIIKIEFTFDREFAIFEELDLLWFDYVN